MSHEENKNDSQFCYSAINTIDSMFILDHHSFIPQIFTEPYNVPDLCQALGVQGEDDVVPVSRLMAREWDVDDRH